MAQCILSVTKYRLKPSGIEPLFSPWKGDVLPVDEGSDLSQIIHNTTGYTGDRTPVLRINSPPLYRWAMNPVDLPREGIAPPTYGFSVHHSAAELSRRSINQIHKLQDGEGFAPPSLSV